MENEKGRSIEQVLADAENRFGKTERGYRRMLRRQIAGRLDGPYVDTATLAYLGEIFACWESEGRDIETFASIARDFS